MNNSPQNADLHISGWVPAISKWLSNCFARTCTYNILICHITNMIQIQLLYLILKSMMKRSNNQNYFRRKNNSKCRIGLEYLFDIFYNTKVFKWQDPWKLEFSLFDFSSRTNQNVHKKSEFFLSRSPHFSVFFLVWSPNLL